MDFELEELKLDEQLEDIERAGRRYGFPTVTINESHMFFNLPFAELLRELDYIRISSSPNYIVFQPAKTVSPTSFKLGRPRNYPGRTCVIPVALREKKLRKGVYKIYKFNDGWAIKRYEPLEVKE